jgi:RNA polymerase sigma factor (sigma-70 family)
MKELLMLNCDEIELILNGCEKTFNKFYQKTQRYIYKLCFDILKNHHDCEEALNDVYIKVINNLKSFNGGSFKYWVVTITKNTAN